MGLPGSAASHGSPLSRHLFFMAFRGVERGSRRCAWRQCSSVAGSGEVSLAKELAFLVNEDEEEKQHGHPLPRIITPPTRFHTARLLELRVKKRVKALHHPSGKFHCLMQKVVANPKTLMDAYRHIRIGSNIIEEEEEEEEDRANGNICFTSLSEEVASGEFDVKANTAAVSATKGETLVLPLLKLRIVQEAVRMVLEVVFRPTFSKFSHGGRTNRGHASALRYIRRLVEKPDHWFTVPLNKKADALVVSNLLSFISQQVDDPSLFSFIRSLFDTGVLNLEFGGFPKGKGLPQEGALSPLFINLYLASFDRQFFHMSVRFEALDQSSGGLRAWFRRQLKPASVPTTAAKKPPCVRIYYCRHLDEMFFAACGSIEVAHRLKTETESYLVDVLHLEVGGGGVDVLPCEGGAGVRFLGTLIRKRVVKEGGGVRVVHKLRDKVELFASQKQHAWEGLTLRLGKKWLAHGLGKVEEGRLKKKEQQEMAETSSSSLLTRVTSSFRKPRMLTLHWYKHLLKIWLTQEKDLLNSNGRGYSGNYLLREQVCEPSLPQELRDSFYEFQEQVSAYLNSEDESLHQIMPVPGEGSGMTEILAPVEEMQRRLRSYGLMGGKGRNPIPCYRLIVQEKEEILWWFEGLGRRWREWYRDCDNAEEVMMMVAEGVRRSCIMTLAAKFKVSEVEAEKKFEAELTRIPTAEEVMEGGMRAVAAEGEEMLGGSGGSGPWLLSVVRLVGRGSAAPVCAVVGCSAEAPCVYKVHGGVHRSLKRMGFGMCKQHVKDLYMGLISLNSVDFISSR